MGLGGWVNSVGGKKNNSGEGAGQGFPFFFLENITLLVVAD
jgi:hypothetical protein